MKLEMRIEMQLQPINEGVLDLIYFVRYRDGDEAALKFAYNSMRAYRKHCLSLKGLLLRPQLIISYLTHKKYYLENK